MAGEEVTPAAGITDQAETDVLLECGVKHLGFPFRLAKNKEDLAVEAPPGSSVPFQTA